MGPTVAGAEKITWKPVPAALLKVDDRPVKLWNVYLGEKKAHLILVQLGQRYLMVDTQAREVWEIDAAALKRKGQELVWERKERVAAGTGPKALATEDWVVRDAGRARIVRVRLAAEGRVLEVQLPIQLDLRRLY